MLSFGNCSDIEYYTKKIKSCNTLLDVWRYICNVKKEINQKLNIMKKLAFNGIGLLVMFFSVFLMSSCEKETTTGNEVETTQVKDDSVSGECYNSLVYMREEEKLAHDVYVKMYELWDVKIFDNISKSETVHTNAVKGLLELYGIEDPALPGEGEFSNPELQGLYDTLVTMGSNSLVDALTVGATIEEVDILDLDEAIENCDVDTVKTVYGRLRHGSTHHLKAFVGWLATQGVDYQPQYLSQEEYDEIMNSDWNGDGDGGGCHDSTSYDYDLTEEEAAGLLFMREEEKLAHDVYINMYDLWNIPVFLNISKSETQHTNKVLGLLELYGLEDPALPGVGEFSNDELQSLYNDLMAQGSDSLIAGLIVGATIEEVDILDLFERIEQTDKTPIITVYSHLEKGSEAHLRAFVKQLAWRGVDYEPQFLSQEMFDEIMGN